MSQSLMICFYSKVKVLGSTLKSSWSSLSQKALRWSGMVFPLFFIFIETTILLDSNLVFGLDKLRPEH